MKLDLIYDPETLMGLMDSFAKNESMTFHFPDGTDIVYPPGTVELKAVNTKKVWTVKWIWGFIPWPRQVFEVEYTFVVQEKDRNVL